jgi:hypothetical protein
VKQQIREAMAEDRTPRFIVHDNDGIFGQYGNRVTVEQDDSRRSYRCHLDRWLDEVMGIEGIPIPYGAPNASPHVERFVRTLREEALDHFILLTTDHIRRVTVSCWLSPSSMAYCTITDSRPEATSAYEPEILVRTGTAALSGPIHRPYACRWPTRMTSDQLRPQPP